MIPGHHAHTASVLVKSTWRTIMSSGSRPPLLPLLIVFRFIAEALEEAPFGRIGCRKVAGDTALIRDEQKTTPFW